MGAMGSFPQYMLIFLLRAGMRLLARLILLIVLA